MKWVSTANIGIDEVDIVVDDIAIAVRLLLMKLPSLYTADIGVEVP